jgi:hypothetical protein
MHLGALNIPGRRLLLALTVAALAVIVTVVLLVYGILHVMHRASEGPPVLGGSVCCNILSNTTCRQVDGNDSWMTSYLCHTNNSRFMLLILPEGLKVKLIVYTLPQGLNSSSIAEYNVINGVFYALLRNGTRLKMESSSVEFKTAGTVCIVAKVDGKSITRIVAGYKTNSNYVEKMAMLVGYKLVCPTLQAKNVNKVKKS